MCGTILSHSQFAHYPGGFGVFFLAPLPSSASPFFAALNWFYLDVRLLCLASFNISEELGRSREHWTGDVSVTVPSFCCSWAFEIQLIFQTPGSWKTF